MSVSHSHENALHSIALTIVRKARCSSGDREGCSTEMGERTCV